MWVGRVFIRCEGLERFLRDGFLRDVAFLMVVCFCGGWLLGVGVLFDISIVCQLFYDIFLVLGWLVLLLVGLMLFLDELVLVCLFC